MEIPSSVVARVEGAIERFGLLEPESRVVVALSGGKDSLLLCTILRELKYAVIPVTVDMGYEVGWAGRIRELAKSIGFDVELIDVRSTREQLALPAPRRADLRLNLSVLNSLGTTAATSGYTPCTSCYNAKVLAINSAMERLGTSVVAFGHHATDAAASLLKSALMYIDRWDLGHEVFEIENFRNLANDLNRELTLRPSGGAIVARIDAVVRDFRASTDEPPRQALIDGSDGQVVRPLFDLHEADILVETESQRFTPEPSGCGHSASASTLTPREIVQLQVLHGVRDHGVLAMIHGWISVALDQHGALTFDARRDRDGLLGARYKPSPQHIRKY